MVDLKNWEKKVFIRSLVIQVRENNTSLTPLHLHCMGEAKRNCRGIGMFRAKKYAHTDDVPSTAWESHFI